MNTGDVLHLRSFCRIDVTRNRGNTYGLKSYPGKPVGESQAIAFSKVFISGERDHRLRY